MKKLKLLNKYSYLHSINGSLIEAELDDVSVGEVGNDSNLLIVFYVQIMPDDFVMQLHRF